MVLLGYMLSTLTKPLFATATDWTNVLIIRFMDGVGKATRTAPRDSLLSASVPKESLGKVFGIHRTLDQSGAILGPLLAILLLPILSFRGLFVFSLLPGALALFVLLFFVKEAASVRPGETPLGDIRRSLSPEFLKFLAIVALFSIGAFNFSFILIRAGEAGIPEQYVPGVYMLINIFHAIIGIPAGALSDRIGRGKVLALGYLILGCGDLILILLSNGILQVLVVAALFGLYFGTIETVQRATVPTFTDESLRGTAYGIYYLVVGVGYLFANIVVGYLWDTIGPSAPFTYSFFTSLVSAVAMIALIKTPAARRIK